MRFGDSVKRSTGSLPAGPCLLLNARSVSCYSRGLAIGKLLR